jgi:hypothetical protein
VKNVSRTSAKDFIISSLIHKEYKASVSSHAYVSAKVAFSNSGRQGRKEINAG